MKVARHWTRETVESVDEDGREISAAAWGWSASSIDEARHRAIAAAQRVLQWLIDPRRHDAPRESVQYTYLADRPPREEIIQEFHDGAGEPLALVTRNAYGSLVLNARDLMFVDVDLPRPSLRPARLLRALFGGREPAVSPSEEQALEKIRAWCAARPDISLRLYRTAAGFRACLVDRPRPANAAASRAILDELGADPLYRRLCEVQECFRARLTPKPWRIGLRAPTDRYPFLDAAAAERHHEWLRLYDDHAPRYATCRLVETHGPDKVHPDLASLVMLHDSLTAATQKNLTLA
jgi:hypothetical protein